MKKLNTYLTFSGNCEEALNFYKNCLGGEITSLNTFEGSPMPVPDDYKKKIMHSEFKSDGIYFMASDSVPGHPSVIGNNFSLSIDLSDEKEQEAIFNKLSAGGKVTMPLQDAFWGAKFGMLEDKFGIHWMLNVNKAQK